MSLPPSGRWRPPTRRSASPRAAYYPSITITPNFGYESRMLASLFSAPSALWAIGAQFAQPLFSAGRLDANVEFARANYDATVANYRRVVLTAMQEVEDGITSLSALESADRQARTRGRDRAPRPRARDRALRGRRDDLPRRHHRPAGAARGRAAGGPALGSAPAHVGLPDQGARRRLGPAGAGRRQLGRRQARGLKSPGAASVLVMALPMRGEETTDDCPSHRIPAIASRDADRAGAAARARRGEPDRHRRRPIPRPRRPDQGGAGRAAAGARRCRRS